jgi:hypothetical protein
MATTIPGYSVKVGTGGIPIYTPKKATAPPLKWQPPGIKYTGALGTGGIPIYTPNRVAAPPAGGGQPAVTTPVPGRAGFWNIPDYDTLLAGDWEPGEAAIRGKELTDTRRAQFARAFKQAYIDWGGDPSRLSSEYRQYLDDPTIQAAKENKYSAMAQNLAAMTKALRNQDARNESMGMATSGRSVTQAREGLEGKEKADWGDYRTFLGGAEEGLTGISEADRQAADMIYEARRSAAARLAQTHPRTWQPGTEEQASTDAVLAGTAPASTPVAQKPVLRWGGRDIFTKAQLQAALGYNQNLTTWRRQHPGLWEKLA